MFHDATVSKFINLDTELHIETEEFSVGPNEEMPPHRILISAIGNIFRNGAKVVAFHVESDDAEIMELKKSTEGVELSLFWHFWNPRAPDVFAFYLFPMAALQIEPIDGGRPAMVQDPSGI